MVVVATCKRRSRYGTVGFAFPPQTELKGSMVAAARAFGPEDDITVLTLAFPPAEVLRA